MNCPMKGRQHLLLDYSAGRLAAEESDRLKSHVDACDACRLFVEDQRAVWQALGAWEAEPVSAEFDRRLYNRILEPATWWERLTAALQTTAWWRGAPAATAACVLLAAGIAVHRGAIAPPAVNPMNDVAQVEALQPEQIEHALDAMETLNDFNRQERVERGEPTI
jgi:anti-sigma-K factor RskA